MQWEWFDLWQVNYCLLLLLHFLSCCRLCCHLGVPSIYPTLPNLTLPYLNWTTYSTFACLCLLLWLYYENWCELSTSHLFSSVSFFYFKISQTTRWWILNEYKLLCPNTSAQINPCLNFTSDPVLVRTVDNFWLHLIFWILKFR